MKAILFFSAFLGCILVANAQVGIGTTNPDGSSILDLTATDKGMLVPRMTEVQKGLIVSPANGLLIYQTDGAVSGFYYYNGSAWAVLGEGLDTQNTLDAAYNEGGAGVGRIITADNGAVDIQGNGGLRVEGTIVAAANIVHDGDVDTSISFTPDRLEVDAGSINYLNIDNAMSEVSFNEDGNIIDFRVESDNENDMLVVDGSLDRVGINRINPQSTFHISGNMDGSGAAVQIDAGNTQDGILMNLNGSSSSTTDNVDGINILHNVNFTGSGARPSGLTISMNGSSSATNSSVRAIDISLNGPSNYLGNVYGSYILDLSTADNTLYGYFVSANSTGTNNAYGSYNTLGGTGTGSIYGTYNSLIGTGTGAKYGTFNSINSGSNGTHYGVYSDAQSPTGYAGYFLGRTSLGNGTTNRYLMPAIDGTAGQVMTTDGAGNVIFQTALGDGNTQNTLDQAYDEGGAGAGSIINATDGTVTISGEDGLIVMGTANAGASFDPGGGVKMYFSPRTAAFRAGITNADEWNSSNVGLGSVAFGNSTIASGDGSFSAGSGHLNTGDYSVSFGDRNRAYAYAETAIGLFNTTEVSTDGTVSNLTDRLFSIGNGINNGNRSNAFTVFKNGEVTINDAYTMPTVDGTADQVLTTDGAGNTSWQNTTTPFEIKDPKYPDGFSGMEPVYMKDLLTTPYTVPAGKNLYITNVRSTGGTIALRFSTNIVLGGIHNAGNYGALTNPLVASNGDIIDATDDSLIISGFLVNATVTPTSTVGINYTVPANKILVLLNISSGTLQIDGVIFYSGNGNTQTGSNPGVTSFHNPIFLNEGQVVNLFGSGSLNGYLFDK